MAFLKYRTGNSPTQWSSQPTNGTALTNAEIDSNFATLNAKKLESSDPTLSTVTTNGASTSVLCTFSNANGIKLKTIQPTNVGDPILIIGTDPSVPGYSMNSSSISLWPGYSIYASQVDIMGAHTAWGSPRVSGDTIYAGDVNITGGVAAIQNKVGAGAARGGNVEIHGGALDPYNIGDNTWDGYTQNMTHGNINIGTVAEVSGRATNYINIGRLNLTNIDTGWQTYTNWKSSITTIKGTFNLDNVNSAADSTGAAWTTNSPEVVISSFTYPRFDPVGTYSKQTAYWYSPTESTFGGIRLGSSTSSYLYSADFYQRRTEIYGYNTNAYADYAALKVTQGGSGVGLAIVANDQNHIVLKASVTANDRGPRISLNHTSANRGDVLSFLINPYYQTGGVVDQYVEMGFCGPWGIGGNNVQAGPVGAVDLANRRYTRGYLLGNDTAFYRHGSTGNAIILNGGYQDYVSSSWVTKYSVSGYAIKQEMNWGGNDYNMFTWYRSDSAGPNTIGNNISGWVEMMKIGVDVLGAHALSVSGKIFASNDIIAYYSSDETLKTNIVRIDNALSKVNTLDGITFNWNEKALGHDPVKREAGVIAQQVQKILPEVVQEREDGTLAVKYDQLVPLLIEAIKELTSKVENLQNQLNNK